jgi:hypothetical protein
MINIQSLYNFAMDVLSGLSNFLSGLMSSLMGLINNLIGYLHTLSLIDFAALGFMGALYFMYFLAIILIAIFMSFFVLMWTALFLLNLYVRIFHRKELKAIQDFAQNRTPEQEAKMKIWNESEPDKANLEASNTTLIDSSSADAVVEKIKKDE